MVRVAARTDSKGKQKANATSRQKSTPSAKERTVPLAAFAASAGRWSASRIRAAGKRLRDPLVVTWVAAGIAAIALGIAFLQETRSPPGRSTDSEGEEVNESIAGVDAGLSVTGDPPAVTADSNDKVPVEAAQNRRPPVEAVREPASIASHEPVIASRPIVGPPVVTRESILQAMAQQVLRFEQSTPVPLETLVLQIEEMAGVPIRFAESASNALRTQEVTVSLGEATLADVLAEAAAQAGLEPIIEDDAVRLVPAEGELQVLSGTADESSDPASM